VPCGFAQSLATPATLTSTLLSLWRTIRPSPSFCRLRWAFGCALGRAASWGALDCWACGVHALVLCRRCCISRFVSGLAVCGLVCCRGTRAVGCAVRRQAPARRQVYVDPSLRPKKRSRQAAGAGLATRRRHLSPSSGASARSLRASAGGGAASVAGSDAARRMKLEPKASGVGTSGGGSAAPGALFVRPSQREVLLEAAKTALDNTKSLELMLRRHGQADAVVGGRLRAPAAGPRLLVRSCASGTSYTFSDVDAVPAVINAFAPPCTLLLLGRLAVRLPSFVLLLSCFADVWLRVCSFSRRRCSARSQACGCVAAPVLSVAQSSLLPVGWRVA
jgi:hypothetical protein